MTCNPQYPGQSGCIGTAVSHHTLPMTGFSLWWIPLIAIVLLLVGVSIRAAFRK